MTTDILNEFSKEEIIQWVREKSFFLRITRSDLLFVRWKIQSKKLRDEYQAELDRWDAEKPDFSKRDALVVKFNASKDVSEQLKLAKEIVPYDKALLEHMARTKAMDERQNNIDRLYQQIRDEQS